MIDVTFIIFTAVIFNTITITTIIVTTTISSRSSSSLVTKEGARDLDQFHQTPEPPLLLFFQPAIKMTMIMMTTMMMTMATVRKLHLAAKKRSLTSSDKKMFPILQKIFCSVLEQAMIGVSQRFAQRDCYRVRVGPEIRLKLQIDLESVGQIINYLRVLLSRQVSFNSWVGLGNNLIKLNFC